VPGRLETGVRRRRARLNRSTTSGRKPSRKRHATASMPRPQSKAVERGPRKVGLGREGGGGLGHLVRVGARGGEKTAEEADLILLLVSPAFLNSTYPGFPRWLGFRLTSCPAFGREARRLHGEKRLLLLSPVASDVVRSPVSA
jgi:hypothetical protein